MERSPEYTIIRLLLLLLLLLPFTGCGGGGGGASTSGTVAQPSTATLRLGVSGQLPTDSPPIAGGYIELILPAGVTISGDAASAVIVNSQAVGKPQTALVDYTSATATSGAKLSFFLLLVEPVVTLAKLELPTVRCTVAPGVLFRPTDVVVSGFVMNQLNAKIPSVSISILP